MALAVGYAIALAFVLAGSALHTYADSRPVAARDPIRIALVALVGANTVGAAFFAIRMIPARPLLGTIGAFIAATAALLARLAVLAALRAEEARNSRLQVSETEPTGESVAEDRVAERGETSLWPHSNGTIVVPHDALVVLVGAAGCGKSTFAARWFSQSQIVSSDECRLLVSDDVRKTSKDAFRLMYTLIGMRMKRGRLTVADATNVNPDKRSELLAIAKQHRRPVIAIVLALPEELCRERNEARIDRVVPVPAIKGQAKRARESLPLLAQEGFAEVYAIRTAEELDDVRVVVAEARQAKR